MTEPLTLREPEVTALCRELAATLKAPEVGPALAAAGCADPTPQFGKKRRLRAAVDATQERDGHSGALLGLRAAAQEALDAAARRDALVTSAEPPDPGVSARERIRGEDGFVIEVGVSYRGGRQNPQVALVVCPDLEGFPVELSDKATCELIQALLAARRETVGRRQQAETGEPAPV